MESAGSTTNIFGAINHPFQRYTESLKSFILLIDHQMKFRKIIVSLLLASGVMHSVAQATEITSPDRSITLRAKATDGKLFYSVIFDGKPIINDSRLGVELRGGAFAGDLVVTGSETTSFDETWKPVSGDFSEYRNHYNELTLNLEEAVAPHRKMQVILRAYDDGVAFRYVFPEQPGLKTVDFLNEYSAVSIQSENPVAWYAASSTGISGPSQFDAIQGNCRTPFTIEVADDCYVSLHEAAVVNSSDAMLRIGDDQRTLTYVSSMKRPTGAVSAWRTVSIASTAAELVESSLILNLNEPSKVADTSWIKTGVSLWDWRNHGGVADDGFVYGINTESYIRYIDFAHENGLPFVIIDAEWYGPERDVESDPTTYEHEIDMLQICGHAKKKGVGIWLYINDKALKHFDLDKTLSTYQDWGIVGIKHGFLGGGNQVKNEFSIKVLEKCAEYQLMYNLHEPNKPTGVRRTYPHYISREYVNSMLDSAKRPSATPSEICTFPVVHNLAGPVDRSCGLFDMDDSIARSKVHKQIPSTVVSQAAQCLIFPSGILTLPDMPDAYKRKMDLFEFIKQLPMTWDETRALNLEIGKFVTIARRSGNEWMVASVADESGRSFELALDFLEAGVTYDVTLYEDTDESHYQYAGGQNRTEARKLGVKFVPTPSKRELYQVRKKQLKKGDIIDVKIAPGGGHCLWIRPSKS